MVYSYFRDDPDGSIVRELIACALREVADEVCRDHVRTISQEAQITSRIGQALETRLRGSNFNGYTIEVVTQDIPDRGRGALERRLGGDIYVGIRPNSYCSLERNYWLDPRRIETPVLIKCRS